MPLPDSGARQALERLVEAAGDGRLDQVCGDLGVRVLGAFGSATRDDIPEPADLDVAVGYLGRPQELVLIDALARLSRFDRLDLVVIDGADPLLRAEAFVGVPLYEATPGAYANEQLAALAERRDTDWLRRLDRRTLAR